MGSKTGRIHMPSINWKGSIVIASVALALAATLGVQCGGAATPTTPPGATAAPEVATAAPTHEQVAPTTAPAAATPTAATGATVTAGGQVPAPYAGMKNPYTLNDKAAMDAGEAIYKGSCQGCHGEKGDGKGPVATGLNPPPADFTKLGSRFSDQPDREFWILSEGFPGSAMPAFKARLSEQQRWQVLTYVWSFGE